MTRGLRFAAVLFAAMGAMAQAPQAEDRSQRLRDFLGLDKAPDEAAAKRGAPIYARNCGFCHGPQARGAEGPDLVRSAVVLHDENGERIGEVILKGRADRGMPAFPGFSQDQVRDVAAFLHQQVELAANRGTYQLQNIVTGDAAAGERYFNGAGGCTKCHSVTGDLAHIAAKYQPPELQAAFLYPGSVTRKQQEAVVTLASGERIEGRIKMLDDFDVTVIDGAGKVHSYARVDGVKVEVKDPYKQHRDLLPQYSDADMHNLLAYLVRLK